MRESGWYRVKYQGVWQFVFWNGYYWCRSASLLYDHDFDEIDPTRQDPEPKKETEPDPYLQTR